MKPRQTSFLPSLNPTLEHGGRIRHGKRKLARPFDPKRPLHLVLRSSLAHGPFSLLHRRHKGLIHKELIRIAKKNGIRIYRFSNVGNHLHLLVQARKRLHFQRFLREFSGRIALVITGARKGKPWKFWDGLAYTRIVNWGRDYQNTFQYLILNLLEGIGAVTRKTRNGSRRKTHEFIRPISGPWSGVGIALPG